MSLLKKVLVVVDPTAESHRALERAAQLVSNVNDAEMELLICQYEPNVASTPAAKESLMKGTRARLREMARSFSSSEETTVAVDARWDRPLHEGIIRKVMDSKPSLVIKDTHFHSLLKRSILSNTDWNLIRNCRAPLLLVKDRPLAEPVGVLAAVDPTHGNDKPADLDRRIVSLAKELCSSLDGGLDVLHVVDPTPAMVEGVIMAVPEPPGANAAALPDVVDGIETRHRNSFNDFVDAEGIDKTNAHFMRGDPVEQLVTCSEQLNADVVVMGAVSRGRLQTMFIGHTAERTLDRLQCDLLVVKPVGFETAAAATEAF